MAIDRSLNGHDLVGLRFFIADDPAFASGEVVARPRIGVGYAEEWTERPLRFYLSGNPYVSKP
jgi:DNA-3-methyladenine glycosylase